MSSELCITDKPTGRQLRNDLEGCIYSGRLIRSLYVAWKGSTVKARDHSLRPGLVPVPLLMQLSIRLIYCLTGVLEGVGVSSRRHGFREHFRYD